MSRVLASNVGIGLERPPRVRVRPVAALFANDRCLQHCCTALSSTGRYPTIPVIRIAAILRYKVPFHIHR
jgi:hypothetical protein